MFIICYNNNNLITWYRLIVTRDNKGTNLDNILAFKGRKIGIEIIRNTI